MCMEFIILSHLLNTKTAHNAQGHIVYILPYFMTEFVFSQLNEEYEKAYFKVLNIYRAYMAYIIIRRTGQVGQRLLLPSVTFGSPEIST